MKVTGSTIEQLEKDKPRGKCRKWRLWASTSQGRKSRRIAGTWTQAQDALAVFVAELEERVDNPESFGSYAQSWALWRAGSGEYAPGTLANDKRALRAFSRTPLWDMRMDAITPEDCRAALLWLKSHPADGRAQLSNTTMNKLHIALAQVFRQAVDDERLARSPMAKLKPPKPDTREKAAMEPVEIGAVAAALDAQPVDGRVMAVYLMLYAGLRRGEACALFDSDVHDGRIFVTRAVKEADGTMGDPKSYAGRRVIPMPPELAAKVDEWRAIRSALGLGAAVTLCCNTRGGVLRPQNLYRWWVGDGRHAAFRDAIGCSGLTLHQLRHSNLSMMARHVSPFDLKSYAGWSSIEPAKVYVHDDLDALSAGVAAAWRGLNAPNLHQQEKQVRGHAI